MNPKFKAGDTVYYTNPNGVYIGERTKVGNPEANKITCTFDNQEMRDYLAKQPVKPKQLRF